MARHKPKPGWPARWEDELRRLAEQNLSSRTIAEKMSSKFRCHFSRSAVIGKANRLGIEIGYKPWRPIDLSYLVEKGERCLAANNGCTLRIDRIHAIRHKLGLCKQPMCGSKPIPGYTHGFCYHHQAQRLNARRTRTSHEIYSGAVG